MTTRGSSGHLLPLAPIARACMAAGHEVRVAAQRGHRANVEREVPGGPVIGRFQDPDGNTVGVVQA